MVAGYAPVHALARLDGRRSEKYLIHKLQLPAISIAYSKLCTALSNSSRALLAPSGRSRKGRFCGVIDRALPSPRRFSAPAPVTLRFLSFSQRLRLAGAVSGRAVSALSAKRERGSEWLSRRPDPQLSPMERANSFSTALSSPFINCRL